MMERQPDRKRGFVGFGFAIVLGLIIGVFIKRVQIGLIIGLAIGLLASGMMRRR